MRIGVFGGTFDPVHLGHIRAARSVRSVLGLDRVLFVPAGQPWLKASLPVSPVEHRVEMVRLAIARQPGLDLSMVDAERPGPSYAVDTLEILRARLGRQASLFFLLGSDALRDLPRWKDPQRLVRLCRMAAFARPGFRRPDLQVLEEAIPGVSRRVIMLEIPLSDIQATEIRQRAREGRSIRAMVPEAVRRYILEHELYK